MKHQEKGFTLIELMMVIAITATLAAIAIPAYRSYIVRSACEDTKAALVNAANLLERFRAQTNSYIAAGAPTPQNASNATIVVTASTATTYTLTATGTGSLQGRGTLTLQSNGTRGATNGIVNPGFLAADVWNSSCRGL